MRKNLTLVTTPEIAFDEIQFRHYIKSQLQISNEDSFHIRILKRSIDARQKQIKVNLQVEVFVDEAIDTVFQHHFLYQKVETQKQVIIVGAGPAGLFAALRLIELGIKPIILERGKDVKERRRDLANINKHNIVNENSNYCFGEGGAGTYSDGKLYTRATKRGDIRRILEILVKHGANENILADAHPHIGTNKLPKIIENIRNTILDCGGEIHFNHKVVDFIVKQNSIHAVISKDLILQTEKEWKGLAVILATGHSARDIFQLLQHKKISIEAKPFALGIRVEHQQQFINEHQYHGSNSMAFLPAAAYSLVENVPYQNRKKGVFSFCMCPGGFVVPAATAQQEIVVNGMSPSKRDSRYANAGIVVSIDEEDWKKYKDFGALAALEFQKQAEQSAWQSTQTQIAPAQLLVDFVHKKTSSTVLDTSYQPGIVPANMYDILPEVVSACLQKGFIAFEQKIKHFVSHQAQIIGVESRTSSPVKIPRDKETLEHVQTKKLFPCAEGAGYAGGIMSAAIDGERCAESIARMYKQ
jgi:uncharacterized FAD-dependent dehydrogenase